MTTIHRTIEIPAGHCLHLDLPLPADIPAGATADVTVTIAPPAAARAESLLSLAGALSDSKTFAGDSVALVRSVRDEW